MRSRSFTTVIDPELQGRNLQGPRDNWVDGYNNERRQLPEKKRGGGSGPAPTKKSISLNNFWNNLSFKLAIYQKLANFHMDDVWFCAQFLEGFRSYGESPFFRRVTQVTYEI